MCSSVLSSDITTHLNKCSSCKEAASGQLPELLKLVVEARRKAEISNTEVKKSEVLESKLDEETGFSAAFGSYFFHKSLESQQEFYSAAVKATDAVKDFAKKKEIPDAQLLKCRKIALCMVPKKY